jgi:rRNA maturation protein Nop10
VGLPHPAKRCSDLIALRARVLKDRQVRLVQKDTRPDGRRNFRRRFWRRNSVAGSRSSAERVQVIGPPARGLPRLNVAEQGSAGVRSHPQPFSRRRRTRLAMPARFSPEQTCDDFPRSRAQRAASRFNERQCDRNTAAEPRLDVRPARRLPNPAATPPARAARLAR